MGLSADRMAFISTSDYDLTEASQHLQCSLGRRTISAMSIEGVAQFNKMCGHLRLLVEVNAKVGVNTLEYLST